MFTISNGSRGLNGLSGGWLDHTSYESRPGFADRQAFRYISCGSTVASLVIVLTLKAKLLRKAKGTARSIRGRQRLLTASCRAMPNFIIIGAQRCGTTSLYSYLVQHPGIAAALYKEMHFFDEHFYKGLRWYQSHFPTRLSMTMLQQCAVGEATPSYLLHPLAPVRLKQIIPHAKCIVLLRNPVDRAYSHYRRMKRIGLEKLSFEAAIDAEPQRLAGEAEKLFRQSGRSSLDFRRFSYLTRGIYFEQLSKWFEELPPENLLILKSEDFFREPLLALRQVHAFLGLKDIRPTKLIWLNREEYAPMQKELRLRLSSFFAEHNCRLYALLGRDLAWH